MKLIDIITEGSNKKIKCNHCDWSWKESESAQNSAAKLMGGNAIKTDLGHKSIPSEFFNKFANKI